MANPENLKNGVKTRFKAGEEQAKISKKGWEASARARRKKNAARKYLSMIMAMKPVITPGLRDNLIKMGADPDEQEFTAEALTMVALTQKAMKGDTRAIELYLSMFGEDPKTIIEKERLKTQQEAMKAIQNSDGFMESMKDIVQEVFADGGDTPDAVEDE